MLMQVHAGMGSIQLPNLDTVRLCFFDEKFDGFGQFEQFLLDSRNFA